MAKLLKSMANLLESVTDLLKTVADLVKTVADLIKTVMDLHNSVTDLVKTMAAGTPAKQNSGQIGGRRAACEIISWEKSEIFSCL